MPRAVLIIDGAKTDLISFNYDIDQDTKHGKITSFPYLRRLHVVLPSQKALELFLWAISGGEYKQLIVQIFPNNSGERTRKLFFYDCIITNFKLSFSSTGKESMTETIEILALGMKDSESGEEYSHHLRKTFDTTAVETTVIEPTEEPEEEADKKPFRIELKAQNSDIKNGVFGFDTIPDKNVVESDYDKLKKEYNPLSQEILGKEYIPNWLSIRKDQTVELELNWEKKSRADAYSDVSFETHPDFTITPTNLKGATSIQITCKNTNAQSAQLLIKADGETVGALNVFYPEPKSINLKWYFVELEGDKKDYEILKSKIDKTKLKDLLKKGLNPTLIDVNIVNNEAEIVNMVQHNTEYFEKTDIIKKRGKHNYIESDKKELFAGSIQQFVEPNNNIINLYIINRTCISTAELDKGNNTFDAVAGFSPVNTGIAFGILEPDQSKLLPTAVMHEIMHALGLKHLFSEKAKNGNLANQGKKHVFKLKKTNNYMDYKIVKEFTYKWQWVKLHEYSHLN